MDIKRYRKAGDAADALLIQWRALRAAEEALYDAVDQRDRDGVLKSVHAINQAAGSYAKILQTADLQQQLDELRDELKTLRQGGRLRKVGT